MRVLAICGSPRKRGNSDYLLDEALKALEVYRVPYEKIYIADHAIYPCNACYGCLKNGRCIIRDDFAKIYAKIEKCTHLLIAAPIFFYSVPAQLKAFIDRFQALYVRYFVLRKKKPPQKKGYFFSVSASTQRDVFTGAFKTMDFFLRCINARIEAKLCVRGIEEKGDILRHTRALKQAYRIGKRIALDKGR
ncbi:MAG: flavodoxin family protein [Candidatus Omnitrophica bacterium]|nr:flavodoxin family protein [Candidatus Omnitrophota bacterium]